MYVAAIDAILLLILVVVYLRVYRDTRAHFSLGLAVFASLLFAQNILAVYSFLTMGSYISDQFLPFLLSINLVEALGTVVLLGTTTR